MSRAEGTLKLIGAGHAVSGGFTKRSVVEIGEQQIYNLHVDPRIASYMTPGEDIALGWAYLLWYKQSFAVATSDGRVIKRGAFRTFMFSLVLTVLTLVCAGFALRFPVVWIPALLLGFYTYQGMMAFKIATSFAPYHGKASTQQNVIGT